METLRIHMMCEGIHLVVHITTAATKYFHLGPPLPVFLSVLAYLAEGGKYRSTMSETVQAEVLTSTPVFSFGWNFPNTITQPGCTYKYAQWVGWLVNHFCACE